MKIEIDYFPYASEETPLGAQVEHEGAMIYGYGKTQEEAKQRVLALLQAKLAVKVPKRETVELPEQEEESELPLVKCPAYDAQHDEALPAGRNPQEYGDSN